MKDEIIRLWYRPEAFHIGCGSYGSDLVKTADSGLFEICSKCGEELSPVGETTVWVKDTRNYSLLANGRRTMKLNIEVDLTELFADSDYTNVSEAIRDCIKSEVVTAVRTALKKDKRFDKRISDIKDEVLRKLLVTTA